MKHFSKVLGLVLIFSGSVLAQTDVGPTPTKTTDRDGKIIVSDPQAVDVGIRTTTDRQRLSQQVKDLLARFEKSRDAYLKEQEELRRKQRGAATETERQRVREQIKEAREAWQKRLQEFREDAAQRKAELRESMPQRREILDGSINRSSGTLAPDGRTKPRRGSD